MCGFGGIGLLVPFCSSFSTNGIAVEVQVAGRPHLKEVETPFETLTEKEVLIRKRGFQFSIITRKSVRSRLLLASDMKLVFNTQAGGFQFPDAASDRFLKVKARKLVLLIIPKNA